MDNLTDSTKICYINKSANNDMPQVFVFAQNGTSNFDGVKGGVAWNVIKNIGRGSRSVFYYSSQYFVQASWENTCNCTAQIAVKKGHKYHVVKDTTGIVLKPSGEASDLKAIEVANDIEVPNGVTVQYCNDGRIILEKKQVGYGQSAIFKPSNKIYFGLASEITVGSSLQSAVINSRKFFELDLTGLSNILVSLNGNAENGYQFQLEEGS